MSAGSTSNEHRRTAQSADASSKIVCCKNSASGAKKRDERKGKWRANESNVRSSELESARERSAQVKEYSYSPAFLRAAKMAIPG
jgi:hypothetical protein